ncbi:MAG: hypothetical protein K0S74_292 [Chlamydiales bacterium]|nr:hypothetical protein [Chlamydiales bacterium]
MQLVRFTHHTLSTISNTGKNRKFSTDFNFSDPADRGLVGGGLAILANMTWEFHQAYKAGVEKTIVKESNIQSAVDFTVFLPSGKKVNLAASCIH